MTWNISSFKENQNVGKGLMTSKEKIKIDLGEQTQQLLYKYGGEGRTSVLTPQERLGLSKLKPTTMLNSITPSSEIDSSRVCRPLMPVFKGVSNSNKDESMNEYLNFEGNNNGMERVVIMEPLSKITIRESPLINKKSIRSTSSKSRSKSRSKSKKRDNWVSNQSKWYLLIL